MSPRCVACGKPTEKPQDHAGRGASNNCCLHCAHPDGAVQSYEEKLDSMTSLIARTQGPDEEAASAAEIISELPAWADRTES